MATENPLIQIRNHARMAWRFRWFALIAAGLICGAGWVGVAALPNQYEVSTQVYLDTKSMLRPVLKNLAIAPQEQETARLISRTLLVRPNLEAVARKTDMDLAVTTPKEFELLIGNLASRIEVGSTKRSNIFQISFEGTDPKQTYRVVEALLNIFVERSLGESRRDTSSTRQFIEEQIKEYEARLLAAETRLKEFKRQNAGLMPRDGKTYFARLDELSTRVSEASLQLSEAARRVSAIEKQLQGVPKAFKAPGSTAAEKLRASTVDPLVERIYAMRHRLDELLVVYKAKHPDVVAARGILESLEAQYEAQQKETKATESADTGKEEEELEEAVPNPLHQELTVALGNAQAEMAAMQARVDEYLRRQTELRKLVDTVPKVEAELARLNRDYDIDKKNYDELVQRREALKISDEASQTTDDIRFNVIEPPREPIVPTGPHRIILSAGVLVVGLGAGVGLAFLIGLLKPAFYGRDDCESITQLPVLGVVSRVWTRGELFRHRMEVVTFALGCIALLAVCVGVIIVHHFYVDIFSELNVLGRLAQLKERFL
ncbi:MAG: chain-length determining protein [Gammaproteobacteria bacterium]|nr:chain-length determining protein [Gammaproteobacteria bacterium]